MLSYIEPIDFSLISVQTKNNFCPDQDFHLMIAEVSFRRVTDVRVVLYCTLLCKLFFVGLFTVKTPAVTIYTQNDAIPIVTNASNHNPC